MKKILLLFALAITIFSSCTNERDNGGKGLTILCTTSIIGESLSHIVGDSVELKTMMGPGVDPHLYKPTPKDLTAMKNADVIILNGLHLEGKMSEVLGKLSKGKTIIYMSDMIQDQTQFINHSGLENAQDPHFWFDTNLWKEALEGVTEKISEIDMKNASFYNSNWNKYKLEIETTEKVVEHEMEKIPDSLRILITNHDAFSYLGRKFNIKVRGLQGISTVAEFGLKDITDVVEFIIENKVKSIFIESIVSDKAMKAIVDGVKEKGGYVSIGGMLYADALGDAKSKEGTYLGMLEYNAKTIAVGLK